MDGPIKVLAAIPRIKMMIHSSTITQKSAGIPITKPAIMQASCLNIGTLRSFTRRVMRVRRRALKSSVSLEASMPSSTKESMKSAQAIRVMRESTVFMSQSFPPKKPLHLNMASLTKNSITKTNVMTPSQAVQPGQLGSTSKLTPSISTLRMMIRHTNTLSRCSQGWNAPFAFSSTLCCDADLTMAFASSSARSRATCWISSVTWSSSSSSCMSPIVSSSSGATRSCSLAIAMRSTNASRRRLGSEASTTGLPDCLM
mmetsp:Transcript_128051/g.362454  ORF Transcript_128051/g.362454 Transcript_128051/m.362454 type:complete len:257 (+) Transcript_128051:878-1648(+)